LLQVTSPFRTVEFLDKAIAKFMDSGGIRCFWCKRVPHEYNPHWIEVNPEGNLKWQQAKKNHTGDKNCQITLIIETEVFI
jgi:hypothetical protein